MRRLLPFLVGFALTLASFVACQRVFAQVPSPYGVFGGSIPSYLLPSGAPSGTIAFTSDEGILQSNGSTWSGFSGGGLTSVGITAPSMFTVTGSPLTVNGTIALSYSGTALPVADGGTGATSLASAHIGVINAANSWTAAQTFTNSDLLLLGSSTGATTFTSANASSTAYTLTFPAATDTVVTLAATQTLTNKSIAASEVNSGQVAITNGGTGASSLAGASIATYTGAITTGHCAEWYSSTQIEDSGSACGSGGGNVSNSGTPTQYQIPAWVNSTTIEGIGPGTSGQALVSGGASAYPSYSATLSAVTSVNGTTIPSSATLLTSGGALGTPSSGTLTNASGLPVGGIASIAADTIVANNTGGSASPTAVAIPSTTLAYLVAATTFTETPTGCTPSATSGSAFAGTITLASGPCTSIVITMNGATGYTAAHGFHCDVGDRTTQLAGTWIPNWGESATTATTATIPIPTAAGATDVISFACTPY